MSTKKVLLALASILLFVSPALAQSNPPLFSPAVLSVYANPICLQGSAAGQQLVLAACSNPTVDSQLITFEQVQVDGPDNWYRLKFGTSNDCVDVSGAGTGIDVAVIRYPCKTVGFDNQLWKLSKAGSSTNIQLVNRNSQKCLDQKDRSVGTALIQYDCKSSATWANQVFTTNHPVPAS